MSKQVKKEEYNEWLLHPATQAFFQTLLESRERLKEDWASGQFRDNPSLEARAQGQCEILSQFLSVDEIVEG